MNLFYAPDITPGDYRLDAAESKHLIKVLRMREGDVVHFTDGKGYFYECEIVLAHPHACVVKVIKKYKGDDNRDYQLVVAVAPTKSINRYEWFLEKATEFGTDRFIPFFSEHSERRVIKKERLNRVITAAVKQSLKSHHPVLEDPVNFDRLINMPFEGQKLIAYIHPEVTQSLSDVYLKGNNALVLIGPEGDFSPAEVQRARQAGFVPVCLGPYRLRTETAAIAACHTIHLLNR